MARMATWGGIDDSGEFADAEGAEIADRECAAGHFILFETLGAGAIDQVNAALADFLEAHLVNVSQDRNDQAIRDGDGDAEIHVGVAGDGGSIECRVEGGMPQEGGGDGLGDKVADAQADFFRVEYLVEFGPQLHQILDVHVDGFVKVRNILLGGLKAFGDRGTHLGQGN